MVVREEGKELRRRVGPSLFGTSATLRSQQHEASSGSRAHVVGIEPALVCSGTSSHHLVLRVELE
jgi:hypothetical protein